jgi:hypothetical protein
MNKLFKVLFVTVFTMSINGHAADTCNAPARDKTTREIDLRSEMPRMRDQDSVGWCYGFTAADLLTHYLYKTRAKEVSLPDKNADYRNPKYAVSAVGMSVIFNREKSFDFFRNTFDAKNSNELAQKYKKNVVPESGTIVAALESAKENGFCFEKDLPSENFGYVEDTHCAVKGRCNLNEMLKIVFDAQKENRQCDNVQTVKKLFPTVSENSIKTIVATTQRSFAMQSLAKIACHKRFTKNFFSADEPTLHYKTLNEPSVKGYNKASTLTTRDDLINNVDEVLNKGTPVGILFYADFLLSPNGSENSKHAVSIVGKRFNPETCEVEYLLKNSWGATCDIYNTENPKYGPCTQTTKKEADPKIIYARMKVCRDEFPPVPRNPRVACDPASGHAIVRKSDLKKFMYGTTYIDE